MKHRPFFDPSQDAGHMSMRCGVMATLWEQVPSTAADTRAALAHVSALARRKQEDATHDALQRAAAKAADRRFTGASLTGFGELA